MSAKYQLSDWVWVFYPVLTVVFMLVGINYVVNNGQASLNSLMVNQEQIEAERQRVENLRLKLELLKTIDKETSLKQLEKMLVAMPASRQVWLLINELKIIGQRSGMAVESYKGSVGDVREATESASVATESAQQKVESPKEMVLLIVYELADINKLATALAESEKMLPLVKIVSVNFEKGKAEINMEGAWSAWPRFVNDPERQLVFTRGQISQTITKLEKFEVPEISTESVTLAPVEEIEIFEEAEEATASGLPEG